MALVSMLISTSTTMSEERREESEGILETTPSGDILHTSKHVCIECKRRKLRCSRNVPACTQCSRHRRHCAYEKEWRSPLTRRHLTEVEQELARAKSLLQRLHPEQDTTKSLSHATSSPANLSLPKFDGQRSRVRTESITRLPVPTSNGPMDDILESHDEIHNPNDDISQANEPSQIWPVIPRKTKDLSLPTRKSIVKNIEVPPAQGLFEWDERTGSPGEEGSGDGMAILTSENEKGGYLGVASGAALLRLTETGSSNPYVGRFHQLANGSVPDVSSVLAPVQLGSYVDAYFQTYHLCYPMVHEPTFRAQLMEVIPRPSYQAWQVLLYVIAALGAFSSAAEPTVVDLILFKEAEKHFCLDLLETGSILLVQATALMANYLQKRNKPNSGYNYLGLARRMAMGIGLHKEWNHSNARFLNLEEKRRTWWCLFVFDSGATITFSRPMDFPTGGIEVDLPLNVHDCDLTATTIQVPISNETTIYTHLRAHSTFHLATSRIYSRIISSSFPSATELIDLGDSYIGGWLASIPDYFSETKAQLPKFVLSHSMLSWRYRNFHILMYRPFVIQRVILDSRTSSTMEDTGQEINEGSAADIVIQRCNTAAAETIQNITSFWHHQEYRSRLACWYALYFLFQAVMIPVICLRNDPQAPNAYIWRDQIQRSLSTVREMVPLSTAAERCLNVINILCGDLLAQNDLQLPSPTKESPQTQLNNLYPLLWAPLGSELNYGNDATMQDPSFMDFFNQFPVFDEQQAQ